MQNKYTIMSDIFVGESLSIDKYEPNKVANGLNHATFFVASDDIDVVDLQLYREQTKTEYLIAIKTSNKYFNCLNIADNIIECLPNEIEMAIYGLASISSKCAFIGIDWNDFEKEISGGGGIQFIQSHANGENCVNKACNALALRMHQIKSDKRLKSVMINIFADTSFDFEKQEIITNKINENLNVDLANIYYQVNFFDKFNYWESGEQGCCIGMFLITSGKDYKEHDSNEAQKDTAIQAYLKRQ
ncbi:hypothetical protein HG532_11280 [Moraxella osloensis]|nr:hypothetical protein [Moraxella osloensis]MBW4010591.1 hypothetical protein [Moraxella osloensis]